MRRQRVSRRTMLGASAKAGVGAAGIALVGCGDDDDDVVAQVAEQADEQSQAQTEQAAEQQAEQAAEQADTDTNLSRPAREEEEEEQAAEQAVVARMDMTPVDGGTIVQQSANVYETVDASMTVASPVVQVLARIQSKLLRFSNPDSGELTGDLATGWETPDGQTVVLQLRDGVTWHAEGPGADHPASTAGRALTAEDLAFNINRQKDGLLTDGTDGPFGRKGYWSGIDSIDIDDGAMTMNLGGPDATFVQGLANEFNLMGQPELLNAVEAEAVDISPDKVIGTGPFILTEWIPGESISAVRNPNYFHPGARADSYVWIQSFEDPTAYRIGFEQKQVDSMTDPDPDVIMAIHDGMQDEGYLTYQGVANTVAVYVNSNIEPWNDLRLVKAIDLAINRRQLIQQFHNGLGKVSGPVSWMQQAWAIPQEEITEYGAYSVDRDAALVEANALWQAGGGPDLGPIDWVTSETWALRAAWNSTPEIIAQMFNDAFSTDQFVGVTKSYGEIIPSWFNKTFDPFFSWIPNIEIPDARADMAAAFKTGAPGNIWSVNEPDEIDAKVEAALAELDYDTANALIREVQDFIIENGQFGRCICYNYIYPFLGWNYLHPTLKTETEGWNFLASSLDANDQWIDPNDPTHEGRSAPSPVAI
jgi:ABC-type transport system substrate-binding protein